MDSTLRFKILQRTDSFSRLWRCVGTTFLYTSQGRKWGFNNHKWQICPILIIQVCRFVSGKNYIGLRVLQESFKIKISTSLKKFNTMAFIRIQQYLVAEPIKVQFWVQSYFLWICFPSVAIYFEMAKYWDVVKQWSSYQDIQIVSEQSKQTDNYGPTESWLNQLIILLLEIWLGPSSILPLSEPVYQPWAGCNQTGSAVCHRAEHMCACESKNKQIDTIPEFLRYLSLCSACSDNLKYLFWHLKEV